MGGAEAGSKIDEIIDNFKVMTVNNDEGAKNALTVSLMTGDISSCSRSPPVPFALLLCLA